MHLKQIFERLHFVMEFGYMLKGKIIFFQPQFVSFLYSRLHFDLWRLRQALQFCRPEFCSQSQKKSEHQSFGGGAIFNSMQRLQTHDELLVRLSDVRCHRGWCNHINHTRGLHAQALQFLNRNKNSVPRHLSMLCSPPPSPPGAPSFFFNYRPPPTVRPKHDSSSPTNHRPRFTLINRTVCYPKQIYSSSPSHRVRAQHPYNKI